MRKKDKESPGAASDRLADELAKLLATARELHQRGNAQQAATLYRTILSVDANHPDALHLLGVLAHGSGDYAAACELIGRAASIVPHAPHYQFNHGVSLQAALRHEEAAAAYRRAVAARADYREAYENLGVALQDAGDLDAAADAYRHALELDENSTIANQNLGTLLGNLGQAKRALEHFAKVLARHPAYGDAHTKAAWMLLLQGDFRRGWREYEWRHHSHSFVANNPVRVVPFPKWDGSPLAGKTILIHPEQGLGDEIMFASCYADVLESAGGCVIECDPRLVALLARSFPRAAVLECDRTTHFAWSAELPEIDCRISAGSLPRLLRSKLEDFPASPYLRADPEMRAAWRGKLTSLGKGISVGVSWRGGREARSSSARSIPLEDWRSILSMPDASFVNLQYGDHTAEIAALERDHGVRLQTMEGVDPLTRLDELTALIAALDLVISIDNSTVFMAGAIGTPVWVLLPSSGEWRWLEERATSPWYSSMKLFRQARPGLPAWRDLLQTVQHELAAMRSASRQAVPADPASTVGPSANTPGVRHATGDGAVLLNDTSFWYHFGSSCTSLAIHAELRLRHQRLQSIPIHRINELRGTPDTVEAFDDDARFEVFRAANGDVVEALESAATVYVNGEGTLHGVTTQALTLLYLAHVAKTRLRKKVQLINHSCYPNDTATLSDDRAFAIYRNVYEKLDFVGVRESASADLVEKMGIDATKTFDCLPLFIDRYFRRRGTRSTKHVLVAGSVAWGPTAAGAIGELIKRMHESGFEPRVLIGANAYLASDDAAFLDALSVSHSRYFEVVSVDSEAEWLQTIANAALLVSGRFHHTIAAAFLDTPFLVMESNTPKISGLLAMLNSDGFVSIREPQLVDVLERRSLDLIANPERAILPAGDKARLIQLARRNFAA